MLIRLFVVLTILFGEASMAFATEQNLIALREGDTARFLQGKFEIKLRKIRGYFAEIRYSNKNSRLNIGQTISPLISNCSITLEEIAPETRIARFKSDCPD